MRIDAAQTAGDVTRSVNAAVEDLTKKRATAGTSAEERSRIEAKIAEVRKSGEDRLDTLKREVEAARAAMISTKDVCTETGAPTPTVGATGKGSAVGAGKPESGFISVAASHAEAENLTDEMVLLGRHWNSNTDPLRVDWLSAGLNAWLNHTLQHMRNNMEDLKKDPGRLLAGFFSVLLQALFVVMPLFALRLRGCNLFKRRLYLEHLLVALYSHAFIFMSVLVIPGLGLLGGLAEGRPWLSASMGWLTALAWAWLLLYLFLMQKRIYRQGWTMTLIKYGVVGFS